MGSDHQGKEENGSNGSFVRLSEILDTMERKNREYQASLALIDSASGKMMSTRVSFMGAPGQGQVPGVPPGGVITPSTPAGGPTGGNGEIAVDRMSYVRYICCAMTLFSLTGQPGACINAAVHLWSFVTDQWIDPFAFAIEFNALKHTHALDTAVSSLVWVLEMAAGLEAGRSSPSTCCDHPGLVPMVDEEAAHEMRMGGGVMTGTTNPGTAQGSVTGGGGGQPTTSNTSVASVRFPPGTSSSDSSLETFTALAVQFPCPKRTLYEYLASSKSIMVYLLKVLWLLREYKQVVEVGSRALSLYMLSAPSEYSRNVGKHILHLMVDAQEQLVQQAETFLQQQVTTQPYDTTF